VSSVCEFALQKQQQIDKIWYYERKL